MIDPFLILTPLLILAVFALVRFVGCDSVLGLHDTVLTPPNPVFIPSPGAVPVGQQVFITEQQSGTIYYTLDGTDPIVGAANTFVFDLNTPITILGPTKIRAFFVGSNGAESNIAEGDYTVQVAFRQVASRDLNLSSPTTITTDPFPSDVLAGDLIVVWVWYKSNASTVQIMQDSAGNNYQPAVPPTVGVGPVLSGFTQEIWYVIAATGGSGITVKANFTGTPFTTQKAIFAHDYAGLDPTGPFEAQNSGKGSNAPISAVVSTGPVTTAGKLAFAAAIFQNSGAAGIGFTARVVLATEGNLTEDMFNPPPGQLMATVGCPQGGDWLVQLATFK